jgi:aryl-alcohol dehydrogenase-like predicted oxidoreductase
MGLSAFYGGYESDEKRFEVLDRAIELGETFWDSEWNHSFVCSRGES